VERAASVRERELALLALGAHRGRELATRALLDLGDRPRLVFRGVRAILPARGLDLGRRAGLVRRGFGTIVLARGLVLADRASARAARPWAPPRTAWARP